MKKHVQIDMTLYGNSNTIRFRSNARSLLPYYLYNRLLDELQVELSKTIDDELAYPLEKQLKNEYLEYKPTSYGTLYYSDFKHQFIIKNFHS